MKTVFNNAQCAHVWAQQTQAAGRSDSMSFDGPTLYSYRTPIAHIYPDTHPDRFNVQGRVILITSDRYSATTSGRHMPAMYRAMRGGERYFRVPFVLTDSRDGYNGARHSVVGRTTVGRHADNLEYLRREFDKEGCRLERSRDYNPAHMRELAIRCEDYANAFGLAPLGQMDVCRAREAEITALREIRRVKRETPAYLAKKAREEEIRLANLAARNLANFKRDSERREAWLAGSLNGWYGTDEAGGAYLRLANGRVETSQGANVPLSDAARVLPLLFQLRAAPRGLPIDLAAAIGFATLEQRTVGHFTIDEICDTHVKAGCHRLYWPELEKIAEALAALLGRPL